MTQKKRKKSLGFRITSAIIVVLLLSASGYFIWQISMQVETTFTLLTDINDAKKELQELKDEEAHLLQQKEQLTDENYVKTWARGEYLITKDGEEIYRLPAQND